MLVKKQKNTEKIIRILLESWLSEFDPRWFVKWKIYHIFSKNWEQGRSVEEYINGEVFKVVVGSNNILIFNIKSSEINSDLKIIIARFFSESYLSSSIFSYSILASSCWTNDLAISQLLLSCQKCCYRHIPRSIERLNPRLSMLCEARLPPFMGFNTSCLGSWWVSPITKELWIKHKQRQTFVYRVIILIDFDALFRFRKFNKGLAERDNRFVWNFKYSHNDF